MIRDTCYYPCGFKKTWVRVFYWPSKIVSYELLPISFPRILKSSLITYMFSYNAYIHLAHSPFCSLGLEKLKRSCNNYVIGNSQIKENERE